MTERQPFRGGEFHESFLMGAESIDWPNHLVFTIWSPVDGVAYRISTLTVLEYHFARIGTGDLEPPGDGIPLDNIYVNHGSDFDYWSERIGAFMKDGLDGGTPPICLEFTSPLFGNRKRKIMTRDRDTGLLVVCRSVSVDEFANYSGARPYPHLIPSDESHES